MNYTYSGGMLTGKTTTTTTPIAETFTYNDDGYIATHAIGSDVYSYTYDDNGNITEIKKNNVSQQSYVYDAKNQLTRENNLDINKTIVYTYDGAGNILNKKEYAYTTGDVGTVIDTASYTYDSTWKDKLTSYDGQSISYDSIGNPTSYRGAAMSWFGRRMQSYSKNGTSVTYSYDSDGLRTQKIVNGVAHDYYYVDGLLRFEKHGDEYALNYRYDQNGNLVAISRNVNGTSSMVYVVTNSRGDVIELRTGTGALSAKYTYDSWGKVISVTNAAGETMASNSIAMLNSVRYRGYVYDSETGLYYLQSRYYDPETGRFLNADDVDYIGFDDSPISYNAFAYCGNEPVNYKDIDGNLAISACVLIGATVGLLLGGSIGAIISYYKFKQVKWKYVLVGSLFGVAIGAIAGYSYGLIAGTSKVVSSFALSRKATILSNNISKLTFSKSIKKYIGKRSYYNSTQLLKEIINAATPIKDASLKNGLKWVVPGTMAGSKPGTTVYGTWELVIDFSKKVIVHWLFNSKNK